MNLEDNIYNRVTALLRILWLPFACLKHKCHESNTLELPNPELSDLTHPSAFFSGLRGHFSQTTQILHPMAFEGFLCPLTLSSSLPGEG